MKREREGREEKFWMSEREVNLRRNASGLRSARGGGKMKGEGRR